MSQPPVGVGIAGCAEGVLRRGWVDFQRVAVEASGERGEPSAKE